MKRITSLSLALIICLCAFAACGKKEDDREKSSGPIMSSTDKIAPTEEVNIETAKTEDDFFGEFGNDDYTASAQAGEGNIMIFTIKSKISENKSDEWVIKGYYSEESSLVNYTGAVRYEINHDRTGAEKSRETVYENGAGRIVFDGPDKFTWHNSTDFIEGNTEFARIK